MTRDDDKLMIETPDNWPIWPRLPLKRYGAEQQHREPSGFPQLGVLLDTGLKDGKYHVILAGLYETVAPAVVDVLDGEVRARCDDQDPHTLTEPYRSPRSG